MMTSFSRLNSSSGILTTPARARPLRRLYPKPLPLPPPPPAWIVRGPQQQRHGRSFHEYFVTHLPSSSMHPDSRLPTGPGHKLPRDASVPHEPRPGSSPAVSPLYMPHRDLTVVRIPLRRAKHHFGVATARGNRPYNEDTVQAGTVDMPAFARRAPRSVVIARKPGEAMPAEGLSGDPQIFYYGVFDGHGGLECAEFLRDELHGYVEEASSEFELQSSLRTPGRRSSRQGGTPAPPTPDPTSAEHETPDETRSGEPTRSERSERPDRSDRSEETGPRPEHETRAPSKPYRPAQPEGPDLRAGVESRAHGLKAGLVAEYKNTVGGYFRKFRPEYFDLSSEAEGAEDDGGTGLETVLMYAFLRADLDFVTAQARKPDPEDPIMSELPVNSDEVLGAPHAPPSGHRIGGRVRFKGGSTASIALISTPTPAPYWHPSATCTLAVAHVGDSRILLCETSTGRARPLTSDHHPSTPVESRRLFRWAPQGSMISGDSFGEERIVGLANSRAFGDMGSKRIGVSAEPEISRVEMGPAQFSFLVLASDGVSGSAGDQEIVDLIKEAPTPEEGARRVVEYATEVSTEGDNATCMVVRLGGWERRSEGGLGSLGTKEMRDMRLAEALDPRHRKR